MEKRLKSVDGTCLQDQVYAPYYKLVKKFGEPNGIPDNKTDVEWHIQTPHGVATVYNWKNGKSYCGESGLEIHEIDEWHIGGHNKESARWIKKQL